MNIAPGLESMLHPVADLTELPGNPRRGDVEAVKRSYERFGQRKPIVVRRDGKQTVVVAGNHQLKAARELGWESIAVVFADDLTDDEARGFALADNRVADLGGYDDAYLAIALKEIAYDEDLMLATGYDYDNLSDLLGDGTTGDFDKSKLVLDEVKYVFVEVPASRFADVQLILSALEETHGCRVHTNAT